MSPVLEGEWRCVNWSADIGGSGTYCWFVQTGSGGGGGTGGGGGGGDWIGWFDYFRGDPQFMEMDPPPLMECSVYSGEGGKAAREGAVTAWYKSQLFLSYGGLAAAGADSDFTGKKYMAWFNDGGVWRGATFLKDRPLGDSIQFTELIAPACPE